MMMRQEQRDAEDKLSDEKLSNGGSSGCNSATIGRDGRVNGSHILRPVMEMFDSPSVKRRTRHVTRLNMGEAKDDIHVCIMCLRAIMNNKVSRIISVY